MPSLKPHGQMSEAFITALFLSVSGGLQDVYTYLYRGKVFANAQTGNIVLMAVKLFAGEWGEALHYLMPLCAFALGIFVAEFIRLKLKRMQGLHWRQLVVLFEICLLYTSLRGAGGLAAGKDGGKAQSPGGLQCGKGIPADVKGPVEGAGHRAACPLGRCPGGGVDGLQGLHLSLIHI